MSVALGQFQTSLVGLPIAILAKGSESTVARGWVSDHVDDGL